MLFIPINELSFHSIDFKKQIFLIKGVTAVLVGAAVTIVDTLFPNKFSTILEVDYDTPYRYFVGNDAHIIGSLGPANGHTCPHHKSATNTSKSNYILNLGIN